MPTLITAVIRPHELASVTTALKRAGVVGLTVNEVTGRGRQGGHTETYRGTEYKVDLLPKVELEAVVDSGSTAAVVAVIADHAASGKVGDGKVWTRTVESIQRIRTGDVGDDAI